MNLFLRNEKARINKISLVRFKMGCWFKFSTKPSAIDDYFSRRTKVKTKHKAMYLYKIKSTFYKFKINLFYTVRLGK